MNTTIDIEIVILAILISSKHSKFQRLTATSLFLKSIFSSIVPIYDDLKYLWMIYSWSEI